VLGDVLTPHHQTLGPAPGASLRATISLGPQEIPCPSPAVFLETACQHHISQSSCSSDKVYTASVRVPVRPRLSKENSGRDQETGAVGWQVASGNTALLVFQWVYSQRCDLSEWGEGGEKKPKSQLCLLGTEFCFVLDLVSVKI
jgi:hypothetical protein